MEKLELKHLAPYLPYGLKGIEYIGGDLHTLCRLNVDNRAIWTNNTKRTRDRIDCKPILRPLSDLTEDEITELNRICSFFEYNKGYWQLDCIYFTTPDFEVDLEFSEVFEITQKLFELHIDLFGLIEKGLAVSIQDINTK